MGSRSRGRRTEPDLEARFRERQHEGLPIEIAERLSDQVDLNLMPARGECPEHRRMVTDIRRLPNGKQNTQGGA